MEEEDSVSADSDSESMVNIVEIPCSNECKRERLNFKIS